MLPFPFLTRQGARFAGITELADGDCSRRALAQSHCSALEPAGIAPHDLVCGHQVHGVTLAVAGPADRGRGIRADSPPFPATDGVLTCEPGLPLALFVADCVPVLVYDPVHRAGAVVHAGREGTRAGIAEAAVRQMTASFGSVPADLFAVIGPSAGPCCYEVSESLAADWAEAGMPCSGRRLDLWRANGRQLAAAGLPENRIKICEICTICSTRFHSHRRSGDGRRNLAVLML